MPIRPYLKGAVFALHDVRAMSVAFQDVCAAYQRPAERDDHEFGLSTPEMSGNSGLATNGTEFDPRYVVHAPAD